MRTARWYVTLTICAWLIAGNAGAQTRALHWDSLVVHTTVDADGALHVTERHTMVFDGEWNGGERVFQLRPWQRLRVESLAQVDEAGTRKPWRPGDLDQVGEYRLTGGNVLRWRSRVPTDPPFSNARLTYELRYVITGALIAGENGFTLNHDLAFPKRSGEIRVFDATLELDPVWQPRGSFETRVHRESLRPGESVFATLVLDRADGSRPAAVASESSIPSATSFPWLRGAALCIAMAFAFWQAFALVGRERRAGRFEPALPLERIDAAWLRDNVFNRSPEEVGAAWDLETSASEVSALLARLTQEGKLKSEVREQTVLFIRNPVLHLELMCDRAELAEHERALIDALFIGGSQHTNTELVRQHYRQSGFDPAALIRKTLEKRLPMLYANRTAVPAAAKWITAILLIGGIGGLVGGGIPAPFSVGIGAVTGAAMLVSYAFAAIFAYVYRKNVHDLRARFIRMLVAIAVIVLLFAGVLIAGIVPLLVLQLIGLTLLVLGLINSAFNIARSRDTAEALQLRRALGSARRYFENQLQREQPQLKDEWFPYLLAFGLGPEADRWFQSFGAVQASRTARGHESVAGAQAPRMPSTWTGRGGAFGGGGSSASWASAAGTMSAGVSAASSGSSSGGRGGSGSGSGGGGSRSSGGGGGGGW